MFVWVRRKYAFKLAKVIGMALLLAVIGFYLLPKLLSQFWFLEPYEYQMKEKKYQEPLRVEKIENL